MHDSVKEPVELFIKKASPDDAYYLLLVGASALALIGILIDSLTVVIGSMIVAPLMQPIVETGYGIVSKNRAIALYGARTLARSIGIVVVVSAVLGAVFFWLRVEQNTFVSFVPIPVAAVVVAFISGMLATFGIFSYRIESTIAGLGVAVSLMPPLVASVTGIIYGNPSLWLRALAIFILNVVGVLVGSLVAFYLLNKRAERIEKINIRTKEHEALRNAAKQ